MNLQIRDCVVFQCGTKPTVHLQYHHNVFILYLGVYALVDSGMW